jgi:hypothetical protein
MSQADPSCSPALPTPEDETAARTSPCWQPERVLFLSRHSATYRFREENRTCGLCESAAYLLAARQSRLCTQAWPGMAAYYKSNCRLWVAVARDARLVERYDGRRLP